VALKPKTKLRTLELCQFAVRIIRFDCQHEVRLDIAGPRVPLCTDHELDAEVGRISSAHRNITDLAVQPRPSLKASVTGLKLGRPLDRDSSDAESLTNSSPIGDPEGIHLDQKSPHRASVCDRCSSRAASGCGGRDSEWSAIRKSVNGLRGSLAGLGNDKSASRLECRIPGRCRRSRCRVTCASTGSNLPEADFLGL
jgi:hypothetical protein